MLETQDFESITVRDIVREAKVSVGSFYNSYSSKLEVFYETYKIADEYFETTVRDSLTQEKMEERIYRFFEAYANYTSDKTSLSLTKILFNPHNYRFNRPTDYGIHAVLNDQVQMALDNGEFRSTMDSKEITRF